MKCRKAIPWAIALTGPFLVETAYILAVLLQDLYAPTLDRLAIVLSMTAGVVGVALLPYAVWVRAIAAALYLPIFYALLNVYIVVLACSLDIVCL